MKWKDLRARLNNFFIGFLVGTLLPIITMWVYYWMKFSYRFGFIEFFKEINKRNVMSQVLFICLIPVAALFFLTVWNKMEKFARGVLGITFIYVIITVILHLN